MILFDRDPAGNLRPKPWTRARPPIPFDRAMFPWPFNIALTLCAVGVVLAFTGAAPVPVALFVMAFGGGWGITYCLIQLRRWWHELRWVHSAPAIRALDDEGLL